MKNAKSLVPVLAVLLCVSLSCTFLKDKVSNLSSGSVKVPNIPPFDPNGQMVSPGAYVIRIMAKDEPTLAALADQTEVAERKMMKQIIDENRPKTQPDNRNRASTTLPLEGTEAIAYSQEPPAPAAHLMFQSGEVPLPTGGDGAVFGGFTGFLKGMLADSLTNERFNQKNNKTESVPGGTSAMNVEVGANADGSTVFEIGIVTETEKNGVKARTEARSRIEGQDCPNAEGQVPFTIKMRLSGQSGSSNYDQEATAFVRLVIDDNAEIASETIDVSQGTRRMRNGQTVYVESAVTYRRNAGDSEGTSSNARWVQHTDNATTDDFNESAVSGFSVAYGAANAAIGAAESAWKGGACVKIVATSPGTVGLNSSTSVPVKVIHRKEGTDVPSKLDAKLTGGASIDPTVIPKTAGTLTYVAPGETGKSATIKLTANSRRGRATLDLTASTAGNSFQIVGGLDDWQTSSKVCDVMKPFQLKGTYGIVMNLTGGLSGTYTYSGQYQTHGNGTYTITLPDGPGKLGKMVGTGPGSAMGHSGSGTENYTLTPIEPCS
jgi:hypothetical protein